MFNAIIPLTVLYALKEWVYLYPENGILEHVILFTINRLCILIYTTLFIIYIAPSTLNTRPHINYTLIYFLLCGSNTCWNANNVDRVGIVFSLSNKLSIIHPILVVTLMATVVLVLVTYNELLIKRGKSYLKAAPLLGLLCLLTGSYWSAQEVLWGGWWSWDLVETSLFMTLLLFLVMVHNISKKRGKYLYYRSVKSIILVIYIVYLTNHTPLVKSIHSFVSENSVSLSYIQICYYSIPPVTIINTGPTHHLIYTMALYYVFLVKYLYLSLLGLSTAPELEITKILLTGYSMSIICFWRRKRFFKYLSFFIGPKVLLPITIHLVMYSISIAITPIDGFIVLNTKKIRFTYTHIPPIAVLIVYTMFFSSTFSNVSYFIYQDTGIQTYLNCTEPIKRINKDSNAVFDFINGQRTKLHFSWSINNSVSVWYIKSKATYHFLSGNPF